MKAVFLTKYGNAFNSLEIKNTIKPTPSSTQILIQVEAFGLNFADVLARKGMYKPAPKPPCVLGYEAVGKILALGDSVKEFKIGDRVVAFTRFGAYAEFALVNELAAIKINDQIPACDLLALATQYVTAYYAAIYSTNLFPNQKVLVHAGAGGVGQALIQLCKLKGCKIIATVGSNEKAEFLRNQGLETILNYQNQDFEKEIVRMFGTNAIDVIFDSVGGSVFSKSRRLLSFGGKLISYGASERTNKNWGILSTLNLLKNFGVIHPASLIMKSHSFIGVNLLHIADNKPEIINYCLKKVLDLYIENKIKPVSGGVYSVDEIFQAHDDLENRKTVGKLTIKW